MDLAYPAVKNAVQHGPAQAATAGDDALLDAGSSKLQATTSRLEFIACEIEFPEIPCIPIEKHRDDIASLTASLSQLLASRKKTPAVTVETPAVTVGTSLPSDDEKALSKAIPIVPSQRIGGLNQHSLSALLGAYHPHLPASQLRIFIDRNVHHINYPVIPRWRDRARLRRTQRQCSSILPKDLPPWSVRAEVPTVLQPDWTEEGRYLLYDGFSVELFYTYSEALEKERVPLIAIPYTDAEMKRVLVEKGLVTVAKAEKMVVVGRENWRGPMECMEDEKNEDRMKEIEMGGME